MGTFPIGHHLGRKRLARLAVSFRFISVGLDSYFSAWSADAADDFPISSAGPLLAFLIFARLGAPTSLMTIGGFCPNVKFLGEREDTQIKTMVIDRTNWLIAWVAGPACRTARETGAVSAFRHCCGRSASSTQRVAGARGGFEGGSCGGECGGPDE